MFDATGDDQEFALFEPDVPIPELHAEAALDHEEEFVLVVVVVPDERPLELHQLHLLAVQFTHDLRLPLLAEQRQLLGQVDFLHDGFPPTSSSCPTPYHGGPRRSMVPARGSSSRTGVVIVRLNVKGTVACRWATRSSPGNLRQPWRS